MKIDKEDWAIFAIVVTLASVFVFGVSAEWWL
jgi:hypothetical protein